MLEERSALLSDSRFDLFHLLKRDTFDLHRQVEACMPFSKSDFDLNGYREHLLRTLRLYLPLEEAISQFIFFHGDSLSLEKRFKSHLLISDLLALGESPRSIENIQHCPFIPKIKSSAELVGFLYVIEGSTLGAQFIVRMLKERLGLSEQQMKFYSGYGSATHDMWGTFQGMARCLIPHSEKNAVIESARSIFYLFISWFHCE
jgi:heme oxygenase